MADNYLITGYWGEPHVTAENDRGINAAMFGTGRFVLPVGEQFKAEYIGNNTIRMYDGKLMDNGAAAGIPVGEYVDLLIANAGQGMKRNDLIVFQYKQDASTLIESGVFTVIQGAESSGTASDPALTQADLLSGEAAFDQMALWRVPVSGTTISAPVKLFSVYQNNVSHAANKNNPHGVTREQIQAAPAGYGYGEELLFEGYQGIEGNYQALDLEPYLENKENWGKVIRFSHYYDGNREGYADLAIHSSSNAFISYYLFGGTTGVVLAKRQKFQNTWYPLEWVNPPMYAGIEYCTTERHNGLPVYTKLVDCGVSAHEKVITLHTENINVIRFNARFSGSPMPAINGTLDNAYSAYVTISHTAATIFCGSSMTDKQTYLQIWYTKN